MNFGAEGRYAARRISERSKGMNRVPLSCMAKRKGRRLERAVMAESAHEQALLSCDSLSSESDCFGNAVSPYSEESAVMDMCIKTEPEDQDISHPEYCTEVQGFGAEEVGSGLHLDPDQIKTEIVMVKIMEDNGSLQLCSTTEDFCSSEQLNSSPCLLSKQYKPVRGGAVAEQHSHLQEPSCAESEINEDVHYCVKEEYPDIHVHELSPLSKQCKSEAGEVNVEPHSQVQRPSSSMTSFHFSQHQLCSCKQQNCQCRKTGSRGDELKHQQLSHSGEKRRAYSQCGNTFSQGGSLEVLQLVNSVKKFECRQCGKKISCQKNLKKHEFIHSAEKPYKCNECGKCFSRGNNLKRHQLLHSGEKPHKCIECGKSFSQQGYLKQHQLIHSGEKPYSCNECGKSFSQANHLKHHQLIHSGEKPYECGECGKSFSRSYHLKQHELVHSGEKPYKCNECGKCFSRGNQLERHQRIHSGEKPYKCSDCGKSFALRQYLKKHATTH